MYPLSWWRHQMETVSALLALCAGNSPVPVNSPHKGQWRGALMFSLIYAWINDWVNNREAGDLRRQRGHYDVIVMCMKAYCSAVPHAHVILQYPQVSARHDGVVFPEFDVCGLIKSFQCCRNIALSGSLYNHTRLKQFNDSFHQSSFVSRLARQANHRTVQNGLF